MRTDKPEVCTMWCLLKVCRCLCSLSSDAPFIHWAKHSARLADANHQPVWCLASCCLNHSASCYDKFWQCLLTDHTRCCPGSFLSALPALVVRVPVTQSYPSDSQACHVADLAHLTYSTWTVVSRDHQEKQPFQLAQQVLKTPFYLCSPLHYKVIPNADDIWGGWRLGGEGEGELE